MSAWNYIEPADLAVRSDSFLEDLIKENSVIYPDMDKTVPELRFHAVCAASYATMCGSRFTDFDTHVDALEFVLRPRFTVSFHLDRSLGLMRETKGLSYMYLILGLDLPCEVASAVMGQAILAEARVMVTSHISRMIKKGRPDDETNRYYLTDGDDLSSISKRQRRRLNTIRVFYPKNIEDVFWHAFCSRTKRRSWVFHDFHRLISRSDMNHMGLTSRSTTAYKRTDSAIQTSINLSAWLFAAMSPHSYSVMTGHVSTTWRDEPKFITFQMTRGMKGVISTPVSQQPYSVYFNYAGNWSTANYFYTHISQETDNLYPHILLPVGAICHQGVNGAAVFCTEAVKRELIERGVVPDIQVLDEKAGH